MPLRIVLNQSYPSRINFGRSWLCLATPCPPDDRSYPARIVFFAIIAVSDLTIWPPTIGLTLLNPLFSNHICVWTRLMPTRIGLTQPGSIFGDHGHTMLLSLTPPGSFFADHCCV